MYSLACGALRDLQLAINGNIASSQRLVTVREYYRATRGGENYEPFAAFSKDERPCSLILDSELSDWYPSQSLQKVLIGCLLKPGVWIQSTRSIMNPDLTNFGF